MKYKPCHMQRDSLLGQYRMPYCQAVVVASISMAYWVAWERLLEDRAFAKGDAHSSISIEKPNINKIMEVVKF